MKALAVSFAKLFYKGKEPRERTKGKNQKPEETCETEDRGHQDAESRADESIMESEDSPNELKNRGKLFVGGLCPQTTSKGLEAYFSQFGKVIDAVVIRYPGSSKSRGFGFVTFADVSDAKSAASRDSHFLDGKNIDVRPFVSGKPNPKTSKKEYDFRVFIGGLSENMSTDLLKDFFGSYGEVNEVIIPVDKDKKPKGFGFVSFKYEDAIEKCLAEDFVHLGGKRIYIKRAKPRSDSHSRDLIEMAQDCLQSDMVSRENLILWDNMSTSSTVDNETSSTASGERSEDYSSPTWSNFNSLYRKKTGEEEQNFRELLSEFLISCNIESRDLDENFILFSDDSESEDSNSGAHTDCDSDDSDKDYGADGENETKLLYHLKNELMKVLRDDPSVGGVNDTDVGGCGDVQTSSPMKFRNDNGSLFCVLCQWAPEDNSCESFLNHCRTASHRNKLKDRFPKEQSQTGKLTEESKPKQKKTDSKPKPSAQKPAAQQGISKGQETIQTQGMGEKPNQAQPQRKAKKGGTKAAKKGDNGTIKNAASNLKPEERENKMDERNRIKGLRVMALAKGMSCLKPASDGHLKCSMCKKGIPKSEDFNVVMKNVSMHLQSKGHLKKLLQMENFLKGSLEKNQGGTKSCKSVKNPPSLKARDKTASQEQKVQDKASAQKQKNIIKDMGTKKSQDTNSNSKLCFLCVPCNYFNSNIDLFKVHLKSESHLDCFISRGVSTDLSFDNLNTCKSCGMFLYGSLYYINKHYSKCSGKKT